MPLGSCLLCMALDNRHNSWSSEKLCSRKFGLEWLKEQFRPFFLGGALLDNGVYGSRCHMGCSGVAWKPHPAWCVVVAKLDSNALLIVSCQYSSFPTSAQQKLT